MDRRLAAVPALALTASLTLAPAVMAEDAVTGTFDLTWNECITELPNQDVPDWLGTIDIDGKAYDMAFFNLGMGRPPGEELGENSPSFIEVWAIYDGLEVAFDPECAMTTYEGEMAMWGHDYGTADIEASTFEMTGTVAEAYGEFADLVGHEIEMNGSFYIDPETELEKAPGEFRVS